MPLATLSVDFVAKLATFEGDLKRAAKAAETSGERMAAAFGVAKAGIAGLVAGISVNALVTAFRSVVDGVDALNDLADATGASVENLSALEDVAARTGTSMETVGGAVIKLNKTLADAKPGTDAAAALDALGLSAKELKALDPAEALRRVAVALSGFADDGNKARLTQELFGKSLREVAPLLNDLSRANALNAKVTKEQAEAAEAFNQQLFALQKNATDAARSIASDLVPALTKIFAGFNTGGLIGAGDAIGELIGLGKEYYAARNLKILADDVQLLQLQVATQPKGPGLTVLKADLDTRTAQYTAARDAYLKVRGLDGSAGAAFRISQNYGDAFKQSAPVIGNKPSGNAPAAKKIDPFIDPQDMAAIKALEGTDLARIAALNVQLSGLFSLQRETKGDPAVAAAIAKTREELEKLDPAAQAAAKSAERLKSILAQTPTGQLETALGDIEIINKAFDNGAKSTEQWAEAIRVATGKLGGAAEDIKELGTFAEQAGRNIQDALGTTLEDALSGNFKSIGDLWRNLLISMAAQAAAAKLNDYLFGNTFGGKGTGSGVAGDLFKTFAGFFATGGTLGAGQWGIAGEAGAEIVKGPAQIIPAGAMGGTQVVQHYHINGDVSPQTVALIRNMGASVKADILRSSRTGGAYAGAY